MLLRQTDQVTALINTRHGNYAASCSIDFSDKSPIFYVGRRLKEWEKEGKERNEPGRICLVDEMQVLLSNGWMHL